MTAERLDLGHGHTLTFFSWKPDRDLNPQWADVPDCERVGALNDHPKPDGTPCAGGSVMFDHAPEHLKAGRPTWHVESWEPLSMSPSLLCTGCGDHGFVRDGRWVPA